MSPDDKSATHLAQLREAFDRTFGLAPPELASDHEHVLALRLGGDPYALRLAELTGLEPVGRLVALPGTRAACLGVRGLRGQIVPVFDLALALGMRREAPRWIALFGKAEPVALAFCELEGYLRLAAEDLLPARDACHEGHPFDLMRDGAGVRRILRLPSLVADLAPATLSMESQP